MPRRPWGALPPAPTRYRRPPGPRHCLRLRMQEWAVAYHGTDHCNLPGILSGGLRAGSGQVYQNEVGRGIYCTPYMSDAEAYASKTTLQHNGETRTVQIVLQCRVRPSAIKKTSRDGYWVINNPKDIRPCALALSSPRCETRSWSCFCRRLTQPAA